MSDLSTFYAQNAQADITEEFVVSERFKNKEGKPVPWKLRSMTEEENIEYRKAATKWNKGKSGVRVPDIDYTEYMAILTAASVVYPNLKDGELQKSYGVKGAEFLLRKMLLPGEYGGLVQKVQEINGFDKDINDLMDEVKN